jgi:N-methylhydantoinase A
LDEERARAALNQLAAAMSKVAGRTVNAVAAAQGVLTIANTNMERALRQISVERGHDTREFALLPFGGAGGLHAVALAQALRIPRVIVPTSAGALSAIGVLAANVVKDQSHTVMLADSNGLEKKLDSVFKELERNATLALRGEGFLPAQQLHERSLALRYQGQSFELHTKYVRGNTGAEFHRAHLERYGYSQPDSLVEIVSARLRSSGLVKKLAQHKIKNATEKRHADHKVRAFMGGKSVDVEFYDRDKLPARARLHTPCIVSEYSSTTLIPAGCQAEVDVYGNLVIQVAQNS